MAAVSRMSNPERVVITAVLAGVLRIDDQGRVWRNTKRGEVRSGGAGLETTPESSGKARI